MRRFYSPELPITPDSIVELPADVIRHLSTVLRQQQGSRFELFDGKGSIALCILEPGGKNARIEKISQLAPPRLEIELLQGLAKGEKLEMILQKGTELGLSRFVLTSSERTMVKISASKKSSRAERWQKIVHEACRQCGQPFAPEIKICDNLNTALKGAEGELKLMLWEEASVPLPQLLPEQPPSSISLLVGPEGGFSAAEATQAQAAGFQTVRLGPRILRTETAGLAILSILQYVYGDFVSNVSGFSSGKNGKGLS
jgi:16S rRNA (uracil1498-N3)-methyltransferase